MSKVSKVYQVSNEEFKSIIKESYSYSDCLRKLNLGTRGGSSTDTLKRRIRELNCDTSHFSPKWTVGVVNKRKDLKDVLVENSSYISITSLKKRLVSEGIMDYKCERCGNTGEWLGDKIALQLDHKNGINNDNRIENLRFLCPNCHAATPTFAGRNKKTGD